MPSAERRERKKANAQAAREARQKAQRRSKQFRTARNVGIAVAAFVVLFLILQALVGGNDNKKADGSTDTTEATTETTVPRPPVTLTGFTPDAAKTYTATITTNLGDIVLDLDTRTAPKGTGRFIELARAGFYDGLTWHRASKDFVIQGGDPNGDGSGGSGNPSVVAEVPTDNYPEGSLAAAKSGGDPAGTFDAQFFIVTGPNGQTLPNDYARFGRVTSGLDIAKQIEGFAPDSGDGKPTQPATIDKITITET